MSSVAVRGDLRGRHAGLPRPDLFAAAATCGLALAALVAWGGLVLAQLEDGTYPAGIVLQDAAPVLVGVTLAAAGLLIIAHRSGQVVGWLLLTTALGMITARTAVTAVSAHPGVPSQVTAALLVWVAGGVLHTVMIGTLPLLLPAGRLPHRRLRWYVAAVAAWGVLQWYLPVAHETVQYGIANPLGQGALGRAAHGMYDALHLVIEASSIVLIAIGVAVMLPRWRRADGPERRRTAAFMVPFVVWVLMLRVDYRLQLEGWPRLLLLGGGAVLWSAAIGYAFTRDRLWTIDRSARHLLTAFVLTAVLLVLYATAIAVVSSASSDARGPGAVALACLTFVVGVALRPTARWCSRAVDRLYYGERTRPYQLVRDLAERLSRTVRPQDAPAMLCTTVVDGLRLPGARLAVPTRGGPRELARAGEPGEADAAFELAYDGAVIGNLHVRPRDGDTALDGQDREVLQFLADQAAPAVASLRLYEDLRAGREQLITAREEERRRLRRDIHDGVGPALSALRLRIDTAQSLIPPGEPAAASLEEISGDVAQLIDDVRRVSEGLVPGALAEVGLSGAVRRLAERVSGRAPRVAVRLVPDPLPELPAATEAAAYQITAEAITNVVRHAAARRAEVTLAAEEGALRIEVSDDGTGIPARRDRAGVGLQSMAERAAELGGKFTISSDVRGTVVRATLPPPVPPPPDRRPAR
ncbi:sensor histidine kinase [Actinomadura rubrisoli]|uniref:Sensor histidine kinase n=1 Tax=Actinomadura rubrisoli TaxID=2530368 RepID=A0A4R4ZYP0_9ACTN|nr:sensor histidine kinase [Actinomadura rubrisoli]TDD64528.1 sensor histidine kinase [Actinomadura rubrisoli]